MAQSDLIWLLLAVYGISWCIAFFRGNEELNFEEATEEKGRPKTEGSLNVSDKRKPDLGLE